MKKRVAIIGGGPGGLLTAHALERDAPAAYDIAIFEADKRLGGKIVTRHFAAAAVPYEAGAAELYEYPGHGSDPLRRLVADLGLSTIELRGGTVVLGDRIMRNRDDIRRHLGMKTLRAIEDFRRRGSALLSPQEYYNDNRSKLNRHAWSRRSFHSVLAEIPDEGARRFLKVAVHSDLATEPHLTNGLYGLENCLLDDPRYCRLYAITGGFAQLPQALHKRLSARVELNRPVTRVEQVRPGVYRVASKPGSRVASDEFDVVAVALPNYWLPRIEWGGQRLGHAMHAHHAYYDRPGHYLRIAILFRRPFWRASIADPYFLLDAFGGCCVYDEGTRSDTGGYGVLSWLLSGSDALVMSNLDDDQLVARALATLPRSLAAGRELFVEGRVHRWVGAVSAQPGGYPVREVRLRHLPDPQEHPGLFVVGDYLFDSTINGVFHSANTVAGLIEAYLRRSLSIPGKKTRVSSRFAGATSPADAARPPVRRQL